MTAHKDHSGTPLPQKLGAKPGAGVVVAGLVDNKSCAIDESWQAVRFDYRLDDRPV